MSGAHFRFAFQNKRPWESHSLFSHLRNASASQRVKPFTWPRHKLVLTGRGNTRSVANKIHPGFYFPELKCRASGLSSPSLRALDAAHAPIPHSGLAAGRNPDPINANMNQPRLFQTRAELFTSSGAAVRNMTDVQRDKNNISLT